MKKISLWLGIAISVIAIFLTLRGIDWAKLSETLSQANLLYLIPATFALVLSIYLRSFRWRMLFYPVKGLSIKKLFSALNIGYLFLNVLPARLGEFVRVFVIGKSQNVSKAHALSTIVVERILDIFAILIFLLLLMPFVHLPSWVASSAITISLVFVSIGLIAIILSTKKTTAFFVHFLTKFSILKKAGPVIQNLSLGLATLRKPKIFFSGLSLTLVVWILTGLVTWFSLKSANISDSIFVAFFSLCATTLAAVIPSTPGYIGVYQYVAILSLAPFGIAKEPALGFAILISAINYFGTTTLGIGSLFYEKLSFFELKNTKIIDEKIS